MKDLDPPHPPRDPLLEERFIFGLQALAILWLWPKLVSLSPASADRVTSGALLGQAAILPLATLVVVWLLLRANGESLATIGLRRSRRTIRFVVILGLLSGVLVGVGQLVAAWALSPLPLESAASVFALEGFGDWLAASISGALSGGFCEELVYRGFMLTRLEGLFASRARPGRGLLIAVLLSSTWFGFGHAYQGTSGVVLIGVTGLMFCALTLLFRRQLVPVMIAHAFVDAWAFAGIAAAGGID